MTDDTVWKPIPGYEGRYSISNTGEVLSHYTGKLRGPAFTTSGYRMVALPRNGAGRRYLQNFRVHQLVLEAFVGPRPSKRHVGRHLNDVKTDNRVENLAWGTYSENFEDARRNGRLNYDPNRPPATHCRNGHVRTEANSRRVDYTRDSSVMCLTCEKERARRRRERKRNAAQ